MYKNEFKYLVDPEENVISSAACHPSTLSASLQIQVEPVGRWFEAYLKRRSRNASASFQELEEEQESSEESEDEEFQLEEYPMLRTLDPKDCKVSVKIRTLFIFLELII